jgi:hypothetical protein
MPAANSCQQPGKSCLSNIYTIIPVLDNTYRKSFTCFLKQLCRMNQCQAENEYEVSHSKGYLLFCHWPVE